MPRDSDKNNDSRGRRDRPSGGKGRSGAARGPEKKFAKRGFAGAEGERRPYAGKRDDAKPYAKKPYSGAGKPYGNREDRPPRRDYGDAPRRFDGDAPRPRGDRPFADRPARGGDGEKRSFRPREDRGGDKRPYTPRGDRPNYNRGDRKSDAGDRGDARPAARFQDRKFGDKKPYAPREGGEKRPYTPRGEGFRKDGDRPRGDRPYSARPPREGDRPREKRPFGDRPDRGKEFGRDRGDSKPWQKRDASSPDHAGRNSRPPREGARNFDKPRLRQAAR